MTRLDKKQWQIFGGSMVAVAFALASLPSSAETPLSLAVSQSLTYDSNIMRDNGNKYRDARSTTAVTLGFDKDYGRQSYRASVTAEANRYKNSKYLNNDGYNVLLGFTSTLASSWYVNFDHYTIKEQQSFEEQSGARYPESIISSVTQGFIQYGMYGRWSTNLQIGHSRSDYETVNAYDKSSDYGRLGLRYSPTDLLYFDAGVKKTKIESPKYPLFGGAQLGDPVDRTDYELTSQWIVTGYSKMNARIGWTEERHSRDSQRDYDGLTGSLRWTYSPTGKTTYNVSLSRDTNNAGGSSEYSYTYLGELFGNTRSGSIYSSQSRLTTGISLGMAHQTTAKISLNANVVYRQVKEEERVLRDDIFSGVVSGSTRKTGSYRSFSVGANYEIHRNVKLGCSVERYDRSASLFNREYDGEQVSCNVAVTLD